MYYLHGSESELHYFIYTMHIALQYLELQTLLQLC